MNLVFIVWVFAFICSLIMVILYQSTYDAQIGENPRDYCENHSFFPIVALVLTVVTMLQICWNCKFKSEKNELNTRMIK